MAITQDTLLAGARSRYPITKASATAEGAGTWHSLWKVAGSPTAGSTPTAYGSGGAIPDRSTTGAFGQTNSASQLRAISLRARGTVAGTLVIYDRLWACSGFVTNTTSTQTVSSPTTLTTGRLRDGSSDYSDVELWLEVYTAPGATGATWTCVCPDGGNTSRSMTYTHPANAESVGQMMQVTPLAAAAAGFRSGGTMSFTPSVSSGTAGDIGFTLLRRIAEIDMSVANVQATAGALDLALERVRDDACLALMVQCTTTSTGVILGSLGLSDVTP